MKMTGTPYSMKDFSLGDNPALRPEVVEAAIQLKYKEQFIGRNLLGLNPVKTSNISTIREEASKGEVIWLSSEKAGLPYIDTAFLKGTRRVEAYGAKFEVSREEQEEGHKDEVNVKIANLTHAIASFEDARIFSEILGSSSLNSIEATRPWDVVSGETAGNPIKDLQSSRSAIKTATVANRIPDTVVISEATFGYLTGYDFMKNTLYNTHSGGFINTAKIPPLMNMQVVICDAIDPNDEGQALALKAKEIGLWEERWKLETWNKTGKDLDKPLVAFEYNAMAKGDANIKHAELGCLITDLYTA